MNDSTEVKRVTVNSKLVAFPQKAIYTAEGTKLIDEPVIRTLPATSLTGHTSAIQATDWYTIWRQFFDTWARINGVKFTVQDWRDFLRGLKGLITDHAADQMSLWKLFFEWKSMMEKEALGSQIIISMNTEELLDIFAKQRHAESRPAKPWELITDDEQAAERCSTWRQTCASVGEAAFDKLTPAEQSEFVTFFRAGCWNHKSINAFKNGTVGVSFFWKDHGLAGPVALINKTNTLALKGSSLEQEKRIIERSSSGGIAITGIAGMLFNNSDEKKGLQNLHRFYFQLIANAQRVFAKTSNNRYASHGEAATELIIRRDLYISFMEEVVSRSKSTPGLNNMEKNFVKGMRCLKTVAELAAFGLYSQTLELIVMKLVRRLRGSDGKVQNHLKMGWLLEKIKVFSCRVIADPDLLLHESDNETMNYLPPTLDGTPWIRPELFESISHLSSQLPNLRNIIKQMFMWALEKWVSFASEYKPGGQIESASDDALKTVWIPTTTDAVEGENGAVRVGYRRAPSMSELTYNAINMVKKNGTTDYIRHALTAAQSSLLRSEARQLQSLGLEQIRREAVIQSKILSAKEQREKEAAREARRIESERREVAAMVGFELEEIEYDPAVLAKKGKDWLELQLLYHRKAAAACMAKFPSKTALKNNSLRAAELSRCVEKAKVQNATLPSDTLPGLLPLPPALSDYVIELSEHQLLIHEHADCDESLDDDVDATVDSDSEDES
jgi:hypothetical protein